MEGLELEREEPEGADCDVEAVPDEAPDEEDVAADEEVVMILAEGEEPRPAAGEAPGETPAFIVPVEVDRPGAGRLLGLLVVEVENDELLGAAPATAGVDEEDAAAGSSRPAL